MARMSLKGLSYQVSHTLQADGPHITREDDYSLQETFVITALLQGSGSCFVEGNRHDITPGDMVLLRPEELRCYRYQAGGIHERMSIYLRPAFFSYLWERGYEISLLKPFRDHAPGVGNVIRGESGQRAQALDILRKIRDLMRLDPAAADPIREAEIHLLLLQLLMLLYRWSQNGSPDSTLHNDPAIRRVCGYIQKNLSETLTHEHIRANCHVSRYQLSEVFPKSTGMTLTEYILQKRLIKVAELVRNGAGIEQAANEAGFHNYSHFYKEFVKRKGTSPRKYFKK